MCTFTHISLLHTHLFTSSQGRECDHHLELLKLLDCQFTCTSHSPCTFSLKLEKNHDIFPTMLTLLMDKQPFIESVHSSRNFEEPDHFSDFKWSWIKKKQKSNKDWKHTLCSFLFCIWRRVAPHYRNTLLPHHLYCALRKCTHRRRFNEIKAPSEGTSVDVRVPINTRIRAWLHVMQSFAFEDYLCALWKMRPAMLHYGPLCLFLLFYY